MTIDATDSKDLELSHEFARAYRDLDEERMKAVLAPGARVRVLMPRGYFEYEGAEGLLTTLREFATKWTCEGADTIGVELLTQNILQTGRLVTVDQRVRLRSVNGERRATMVLKHLLAIKDGRIALADELCTGVMPVPG